jgi:hypothetical protein
MAGSNPSNHPALTRDLQAYLRWRNTHARHPATTSRNPRQRWRRQRDRLAG